MQRPNVPIIAGASLGTIGLVQVGRFLLSETLCIGVIGLGLLLSGALLMVLGRRHAPSNP